MRDFWKMIVDYKVSAIVMLCGLEENGEVFTLMQNWTHCHYFRRCAINIGRQMISLESTSLKQLQPRIVMDTLRGRYIFVQTKMIVPHGM